MIERYDHPFLSFRVIFSILAGLALASTLYEVVQIIRNQTVIALYSSFSLYKNVRGIFHTTPRITDPEKQLSVIECVNGVRALSMLWIIIVHIHESIIHVPIENAPGRMDYMGTFGSSILFTSGYLAVDTFLALSGMLVAFNILNELDKNGKINPLKMYLHRYIRITGPYAALILFGVSFAKYMGEGLLWNPIMDHHEASCSKYWWSALLYIQNYVNPTNMVSHFSFLYRRSGRLIPLVFLTCRTYPKIAPSNQTDIRAWVG